MEQHQNTPPAFDSREAVLTALVEWVRIYVELIDREEDPVSHLAAQNEMVGGIRYYLEQLDQLWNLKMESGKG